MKARLGATEAGRCALRWAPFPSQPWDCGTDDDDALLWRQLTSWAPYPGAETQPAGRAAGQSSAQGRTLRTRVVAGRRASAYRGARSAAGMVASCVSSPSETRTGDRPTDRPYTGGALRPSTHAGGIPTSVDQRRGSGVRLPHSLHPVPGQPPSLRSRRLRGTLCPMREIIVRDADGIDELDISVELDAWDGIRLVWWCIVHAIETV